MVSGERYQPSTPLEGLPVSIKSWTRKYDEDLAFLNRGCLNRCKYSGVLSTKDSGIGNVVHR